MAAIMQVENPGNPRMETRLGFGIGKGLDFWLYVNLVRTARGASRRAGVRYYSFSLKWPLDFPHTCGVTATSSCLKGPVESCLF